MKTTKAKKLKALNYEAPFLIEKLVQDQIVQTEEEGLSLFREVKRFLFLIRSDPTMWHMYSRRVDEVWHQFVLFTSEYVDFCSYYFGSYIHHSPGSLDNNSPEKINKKSDGKSAVDHHGKVSTFEGFRDSYQQFFGEPLPKVWWDATSVHRLRRVLNDNAGQMSVRHGEPGMAELLDPESNVVLSISDVAVDSLNFIAGTPGFYVRELPGDLSDNERVEIVSVLVRTLVLRVAP